MTTTPRRRRFGLSLAVSTVLIAATTLFAVPAAAMLPPGDGGSVTTAIADLARANVGKKACSTNSNGGTGFGSSCTGNGGQPEYWCADFAKWVWARNGEKSATLTAAAASFYTWAQNNGAFTKTPSVGSVAIFSNNGAVSDIHHVAVVSAVSGGNITTISGDWGGTSGSEATFAGSSHVVNNGSYGGAPGYKSVMGMYLVGYAQP